MARKKKIEEQAGEIAENIAKAVKEEIKDLTGNGKVEKKQAKKRKTEEAKEEKKPESEEEKIKDKRKKELEERAKKFAEKLGEGDNISIKEKLVEEREKEKERKKTLIPLEKYVKSGIYIGTKVITPHMRPFVYRRRNDGIAIINTNLTDKKLKEVAELLAKYAPEDFIVVCKREAGWKAVQKFSELTGVRVFTKKYPAGILTNAKLPNFFEIEMVFVCDPWMDRNAMHDAKRIKKKVFSLCDTNNYTFDVDYFIPCNNKHNKSIGLVFYLLTREYLKIRGIKKEISEKDFIEEEE